jgi:hypothetical protein
LIQNIVLESQLVPYILLSQLMLQTGRIRWQGRFANLLNRDGRYFARVTVPKELRATIGKRELRIALGADRRVALQKHPLAVAKLPDGAR